VNDLDRMKNWIEELKITSNENGNDESLPHVSVDQLHNNNKQLLAIVNGTAGTGKN
jgi:hypothetical protein